jgi:hypothetical protein
MPNKEKKIEFFFGCIQTMINILIIFFTQYFQEKIMIQWLESPPFNQRVQGSIIFWNFTFLQERNG